MQITLEWLDANKSARGGYSKAQLAAIGLSWPPMPGWKKTVVGVSITEDQQLIFERGRTAPASNDK